MTSQNSKSKLVSFVVPIYQTEKYLKSCLESLLNQDYENVEIVCIADGKSTKAEKIIEKLKSSKVSYHTIKHGGAPKARNEGYKHTKGDYVSFWDSDCYAEPGMVRMWVKVFETYPDISFVYSGYRFNDENLSFAKSRPFDKYMLTCSNYVATMFPMKREIFPGFDENLKSLQDWDMWLTVTEKGHKGFFLEGSAFMTEYRKGISSDGCSKEKWLERYNTVRLKHNIVNRNICFTSMTHAKRGMELAEMFKQDFHDMPSFHPHEYNIIYNIGFYANNMEQASSAFKGASTGCKKIIHWLGDDVESIFLVPYKGVKMLVESLKANIHKHFCENEQARKMLEELGVTAKVLSLPMEWKETPLPKEFKIFYECDGKTFNFIESIKKALPHIKIESPDKCELKEYACFMSLTESEVPSENMKRFIAGGRQVITNYCMLYSGTVEVKKEEVIKKILDCKKKFEDGYVDKKAQDYYKNLISPTKFKEMLDETMLNIRSTSIQQSSLPC